MTVRDIHLPVAAQSRVDSLVPYTQQAEEAGYDCVWMPETWGRDAVTVLTVLAERTDSVELGASILPIYSRSPTLMGQSAATLHEVSEGRFRLGIGPSGPAVIEGWHGASFDRPLRRTREYVEILRQVLLGERVEYQGDVFQLSGFRLRSEPPKNPPKIDVAGLGPKSVELAGRFGDGWHAVVFTPDGIRDRLADLRRGAELGDRDPSDLRTTLSLTCCALGDREHARELARQHIAFYIGGMGTYYRDSLARQGYKEEANDIASAWANGDRETALGEISEELLDHLCAAGTPEEARESIERFEAVDGLDAVAVGFPRGASEGEIEATIEALSP
jgi:coenzyme F420-dependent oxidoreductase